MFKLLSDKATMPVRATLGSAGYDLFAAETKMVNFESGNMLIKTNVSTKCPPGTYGRIAIRSSLAYKQHLAVSAGVIDSDYYPGDIGVIVYCTKPGHSYTVTEGERFAQIVFEKIYIGDDEVTTVRNGGYGSTNILDGKHQDGNIQGECERDASFTPPVPSNSPVSSAPSEIQGNSLSRRPLEGKRADGGFE
jgi:dUTP pyrophosphatase